MMYLRRSPRLARAAATAALLSTLAGCSVATIGVKTQRIAPGASVVGAFHHVSAVTVWGDKDLLDDEDVLVCGDDADAKAVVIELARSLSGRDGIDAGRLRLARQLEPLTAVLISINKRYKIHSGIRISGLAGH